MMHPTLSDGSARLWTPGWGVLVRGILYLVMIGFLAQYVYFGGVGRVLRPVEAILTLAAGFGVTLLIMCLASFGRHIDLLTAATLAIDLAVLSRITLLSGGFNSIFIPCFLPVLVMATAWLPRSYTAVFPSIATFGAAYIGLAHLLASRGAGELLERLYPAELSRILRYSAPHTIAANMLLLTVLFFVLSYFSGILGDKWLREQRLNAEVLSSIKQGMAVIGVRHTVVYMNAEFQRIFPGVAPGGSITPHLEGIFTPEDGITLEQLFTQRPGESVTLIREQAAARPPVEIRISGLSLRGRHSLSGLIFLVTDLSLRRRMELAERSLERFSAISTMAAGLAHEIRNPLASLRSAIQEMGTAAFPAGSQNRLLADVVIAESDRLDDIIGRFLDFSREGELRLSRTRLGKTLARTRELMLLEPNTEGLEVNLDIRDDPQIVCDAVRMEQVFLNLGLNAAQAAPRSGGRVDIAMSSAAMGFAPGVEILFMDNGAGIDENIIQRIFEPFFSRRAGGTGMGLPLSKKQVAMHGGDIIPVNRAEGGACFRVWLPLEASPLQECATRRFERSTPL